MIIDFIIYISTKVFKNYLSGVALLAGILTLTSIALLKFITIKLYPDIGNNATWRGAFQLSYLCYIPVVLLLIFKKVGYSNLTNNVFEKKSFNYYWSLLLVILLCILLIIMFTYILVFW